MLSAEVGGTGALSFANDWLSSSATFQFCATTQIGSIVKMNKQMMSKYGGRRSDDFTKHSEIYFNGT